MSEVSVCFILENAVEWVKAVNFAVWSCSHWARCEFIY